MSFLAFDSFAGLPKNKVDHGIGEKWKIGELVTTEEQFTTQKYTNLKIKKVLSIR